MKEPYLDDYSFNKNYTKKRSRSFDISEKTKKKLLHNFKNKIFKKSNERLLTLYNYNNNSTECEDSEDNHENYKGFALLPNSNFLFTFDLLLIIADLCTFIFLPITLAKNKDLREQGHIIIEIIHYIIDLVFFLDFVISFFRGYYDYEMKIVRNNKLIIKRYLRKFFINDFIQAIPFYNKDVYQA